MYCKLGSNSSTQDFLCHVGEQQVLNRWSNAIRIIKYQRFTGRSRFLRTAIC